MITFIFSLIGSISRVSLTTKIVAIAMAGIGVFQINNMYQRSVGRHQGEANAIEKVKDANENATQIGAEAASKSGNPAPRGGGRKRLPGYRD